MKSCLAFLILFYQSFINFSYSNTNHPKWSELKFVQAITLELNKVNFDSERIYILQKFMRIVFEKEMIHRNYHSSYPNENSLADHYQWGRIGFQSLLVLLNKFNSEYYKRDAIKIIQNRFYYTTFEDLDRFIQSIPNNIVQKEALFAVFPLFYNASFESSQPISANEIVKILAYSFLFQSSKWALFQRFFAIKADGTTMLLDTFPFDKQRIINHLVSYLVRPVPISEVISLGLNLGFSNERYSFYLRISNNVVSLTYSELESLMNTLSFQNEKDSVYRVYLPKVLGGSNLYISDNSPLM